MLVTGLTILSTFKNFIPKFYICNPFSGHCMTQTLLISNVLVHFSEHVAPRPFPDIQFQSYFSPPIVFFPLECYFDQFYLLIFRASCYLETVIILMITNNKVHCILVNGESFVDVLSFNSFQEIENGDDLAKKQSHAISQILRRKDTSRRGHRVTSVVWRRSQNIHRDGQFFQ